AREQAVCKLVVRRTLRLIGYRKVGCPCCRPQGNHRTAKTQTGLLGVFAVRWFHRFKVSLLVAMQQHEHVCSVIHKEQTLGGKRQPKQRARSGRITAAVQQLLENLLSVLCRYHPEAVI